MVRGGEANMSLAEPGGVLGASGAACGRVKVRGGRLGAVLPWRERRRGRTVESTQVYQAEGSKRKRIVPALSISCYRSEAFKLLSGGKWPGAGWRGKLTEPRGPAEKKGGRSEANGQLFGLWLHDL